MTVKEIMVELDIESARRESLTRTLRSRRDLFETRGFSGQVRVWGSAA